MLEHPLTLTPRTFKLCLENASYHFIAGTLKHSILPQARKTHTFVLKEKYFMWQSTIISIILKQNNRI